MKFIHAADLHLDSPLHGLTRYEGAPVAQIRGATRRAVENLVTLALREKIDFLLIAGDVYDGNTDDFNTLLFFSKQMARLDEANIPVFLIAGNHDAQNLMTRSLKLPKNVIRFSADKAHVHTLDHLGVAVHGQSFAHQAETRNLAQSYPEPIRDLFNIGLLHTSADGREGHAPYAPCTLTGLIDKGYDYWALGHIHLRETLCVKPYIAFSGNVQGRHAKEVGPKGCLLVERHGTGPLQVEFRPLDVLRWLRGVVDATGCATLDEIYQRTTETIREKCREAEGLPCALRLEVTGACAAHEALRADRDSVVAQIRAHSFEAGEQVWVEKIKLLTTPPHAAEAVIDLDGPLGELASMMAQWKANPADPAGLGSVNRDFDPLRAKLKQARFEESDLENLTLLQDPAALAGLLDEVESLLFGRLREGACP